ncbi:hypothetical protein ACWD5Q_03940 [Streptomyces sp. NPDC002513]
MTHPTYPPRPAPGDRVAVLSPSSGLAAVIPYGGTVRVDGPTRRITVTY